MARKKPPSFDFFPDDFMGGTYHLEAEAVGIYVRLLCYQWSNGSIPSDERQLARIAGVDAEALRRHMPDLLQKFEVLDCGQLMNSRLEDERQKKLAIIEKSKASANKRWSKQKEHSSESEQDDPARRPDATADANALRPQSDRRCDGNAPYFQLPTSEVIPPSPPDDGVVVPIQLADLWSKWTRHYFDKVGQRMSPIQQEAVLMELCGRGWDKARADIEFSIRIGAKNVKDSNNDFEKQQQQQRGPAINTIPRKESAAERMNRLL